MSEAPEREESKTDSVFDFLYVDHRRIGLYLSQFSEFGNLTQLVKSRSVFEDTSGKAGVPGIVEGRVGQSAQTGTEGHYDTQWSQALNFLDEVHNRAMLERQLSAARIGDLILLSGTLHLADMRTFEKTWDVASNVTPPRPTGNRQQRRAAAAKPHPHRTGQADDLSLLKILGSFEQPILMVFDSAADRLWSTLGTESLIGGATGVNLKHGIRIAGTWHLLAILDCMPGPSNLDASELGRLCGAENNEFSGALLTIWNEFRALLGKPDSYYGVTPLMIFREVSG